MKPLKTILFWLLTILLGRFTGLFYFFFKDHTANDELLGSIVPLLEILAAICSLPYLAGMLVIGRLLQGAAANVRVFVLLLAQVLLSVITLYFIAQDFLFYVLNYAFCGLMLLIGFLMHEHRNIISEQDWP